jgi:hypothetical protein
VKKRGQRAGMKGSVPVADVYRYRERIEHVYSAKEDNRRKKVDLAERRTRDLEQQVRELLRAQERERGPT